VGAPERRLSEVGEGPVQALQLHGGGAWCLVDCLAGQCQTSGSSTSIALVRQREHL